MWSDPIADLLTRMRNALSNRAATVDVPKSKMKVGILSVLKREGFINDFTTSDDPAPQGSITVMLKYGQDNEDVIQKIRRFSKPGRRAYRSVDDLPTVMSGLGICIVSTSKGVKSDRECRAERLGGEVLAIIH